MTAIATTPHATKPTPLHGIGTQFLVEAATLSTAGGLIGIAGGLVTARIVASRFGWTYTTRFDMIALAFVFSALVGIGFRLYPARKASRLHPIEALRYE